MDKEFLEFEIEPLDISELVDHSSEAEEESDDASQRPHPTPDVDEASDRPLSEPQMKLDSVASSTSLSSKASPQETIGDTPIFVKLKLPNGKTITHAANSEMTIFQMKNLICQKFQVSPDIIDLWETVGTLNLIKHDEIELKDLKLNKNSLELIVSTKDPEIELFEFENELSAPVDIITVSIESTHQSSPRQIVVEIENQSVRSFLGGYKCKRTNKEYYHAETQTILENRNRTVFKRSRTCQTSCISETPQQTTVSKEMQTENEFDINEGSHVTIITPSSGSTGCSNKASFADVTSKAITIQRAWRGWRARQSIEKVKTEMHTEKALQEILSLDHKKGYNPAVFEVLYQLVEKWRKKCLDHAYATKTEGPTRADFQDILEMQVHLLGIIEKERVKMREKVQKEKEQKLLEDSCSPVTWKGYKGLKISMETVEGQRAAELKKLYDLLGQENVPIESRKENLTTVQAALRFHKNDKCKEILALINRELQLLGMGFGYKEVHSLHKRIEKLFVNFIREPKISKTMRKDNFYLCIQCKKMLPPTSFVVPLRDPKLKLCTSCHWIDNISHKRIDHQPYQIILRDLRSEEVKYGCYRSLAFVMQVYDVQYLIEQIWHCQSAISQVTDINELRLGRWDAAQDWAPWNNILLTKSEMRDHSQIGQLDKIYGEQFIKNIKVKLLMARMHFKTLYSFATD